MSNTSSETPKARVNITLDVETGGVKEKKELPLKLLLMGDFSNGACQLPLAEREKLSVNKYNLNAILAHFSPRLNLSIEAEDEHYPAHLCFQSIADFNPDNLVQRIPYLQRLMAMRALLKDLRANLIDNADFQQSIQQLFSDKTQISALVPYVENLLTKENDDVTSS